MARGSKEESLREFDERRGGPEKYKEELDSRHPEVFFSSSSAHSSTTITTFTPLFQQHSILSLNIQPTTTFKMQFFAVALFATSALAAVCPTGLFSNPLCCSTNVLDLVGVDCVTREFLLHLRVLGYVQDTVD